jgi:hypothetical protein
MPDKNARKPGDYILDRYLPHASAETREESRENLRRLARLLIRVHTRLARDNPQGKIRGNDGDEVDSESHPQIV